MYWNKCRAGLPEAWVLQDMAWRSWVYSLFRIRTRGIAIYNYLARGLWRKERHSNRTRGKGCGLERGKFRSGIMKTCPQLLVSGMDCTEILWDLRSWRWSKPNWTQNWKIRPCWPSCGGRTWTLGGPCQTQKFCSSTYSAYIETSTLHRTL